MADAASDDPLAHRDRDSRDRAGHAGVLPSPGETLIGDISLPPGHWIVPDPAFSSDPTEAPQPVAWITNDVCTDVAELWLRLRGRFHRSGLWPVVLDTLWGSDERPWDRGELDPAAYSAPETFDPGEVLAACWVAAVPDPADDPDAHQALAPLTSFPGLAPRPIQPQPESQPQSQPEPESDPAANPTRESAPRRKRLSRRDGRRAKRDTTVPTPPQDAGEIVVRGLKGRLGLVPVERPADVVATLGWRGPFNRFIDSGAFAAVLRSWEDRFGAVPVGIGFDTLVLAAHRPPVTAGDAIAVAAEHFAVCPDLVWQETGTIAAYANRIRGRKAWTFWWS